MLLKNTKPKHLWSNRQDLIGTKQHFWVEVLYCWYCPYSPPPPKHPTYPLKKWEGGEAVKPIPEPLQER